jgi:SprT protein
MPKQEAPLHALQKYLPPGSFDRVMAYIEKYRVHLTVSKERKTVLGDYRRPHSYQNHRISVNGNLNPYAFLVTLLHELAHLLAFEQYGNRIEPHGREWKQLYGGILAEFLQAKIFPEDIAHEIKKSLSSPAASSCAEIGLTRVLTRYDPKQDGFALVESLSEGVLFKIEKGTIFKRGPKRRTRFICEEITTGRLFLFSGVYRVEVVNGE